MAKKVEIVALVSVLGQPSYDKSRWANFFGEKLAKVTKGKDKIAAKRRREEQDVKRRHDEETAINDKALSRLIFKDGGEDCCVCYEKQVYIKTCTKEVIDIDLYGLMCKEFHILCMKCLSSMWDLASGPVRYTCPICRVNVRRYSLPPSFVKEGGFQTEHNQDGSMQVWYMKRGERIYLE